MSIKATLALWDRADTIPMREMKPGEIGLTPNNELVMRTMSDFSAAINDLRREVMHLSDPGAGRCWTWGAKEPGPDIPVTILPVGSVVRLEVRDE